MPSIFYEFTLERLVWQVWQCRWLQKYVQHCTEFCGLVHTVRHFRLQCATVSGMTQHDHFRYDITYHSYPQLYFFTLSKKVYFRNAYKTLSKCKAGLRNAVKYGINCITFFELVNLDTFWIAYAVIVAKNGCIIHYKYIQYFPCFTTLRNKILYFTNFSMAF